MWVKDPPKKGGREKRKKEGKKGREKKGKEERIIGKKWYLKARLNLNRIKFEGKPGLN